MICSLVILKHWRSPKCEKTSCEKRRMLLRERGGKAFYYVVFMERKYIKISGSKRAKIKIASNAFFRNGMIVTYFSFILWLLKMRMFRSDSFRMMSISMYGLKQYWKQYCHRQENIDYDVFFFHFRNRLLFWWTLKRQLFSFLFFLVSLLIAILLQI